ncbi:hypothetical protein EBU71_19415 [bacterium]|nr:hypothetical protein [Candidatus Elulimicrobium humile]
MDTLLKQALDFSNYKQSLAIQRKALKEKIDARLTFGYNGGIFKIDRNLISFVQFLIGQERVNDVVLLDSNENPILVSDLAAFRDEILDRYFTSTNEYYQEYEKIRKSRSVEKLVDL